MTYLWTHFAGEIEYDAKTEEWMELASSFVNEKNPLTIFSLLLALKKFIFQEITWQRNHRLFIIIPTDIKKIGRKTTMVFHWFEEIQIYSEQLLCTGYIVNTEEAINVYDKFEKKIILDWPLCESSDIMLALPKIKEYLKKFRKQLLLATFYLIKKIYRAKNKKEKLVIFWINNTEKDIISLLKTKICKKIYWWQKKNLV